MSMMQTVVSQFKQPHGLFGHVAGYIMANRPSNIARNTWTLELLNIQQEDHLLEIGFGPGFAISKAAEIIDRGLIVGVDHSQTMLDQTNRRNASAVKGGRVKLILGSLRNLTSYQNSFDKVFSANVIQFWAEPHDYFFQIYKLLKTGGKIATTYMPRHRNASSEDSRKMANDLVDCLWDTGFKEIEVKEKQLDNLIAICVIAEK